MDPADLDSDGAPSVTGHRLGAWRAFLEAYSHITDVLARELRDEEELPLTWYDVLVHLSEAPEQRLRMQDLANAILLSKSGLTRLVDRMQKAGLVERETCSSDKRGTFANLTDQGMATLRAAAPTHVRGVDEHFASLLDDEEAVVLERILQRLVEANQTAGTSAGS